MHQAEKTAQLPGPETSEAPRYNGAKQDHTTRRVRRQAGPHNRLPGRWIVPRPVCGAGFWLAPLPRSGHCPPSVYRRLVRVALWVVLLMSTERRSLEAPRGRCAVIRFASTAGFDSPGLHCGCGCHRRVQGCLGGDAVPAGSNSKYAKLFPLPYRNVSRWRPASGNWMVPISANVQ